MKKAVAFLSALFIVSNASATSTLSGNMTEVTKEVFKCMHPNGHMKYSEIIWEIDKDNKVEDHVVDFDSDSIIFEGGEAVVHYDNLSADNEMHYIAVYKAVQASGYKRLYIKANVVRETSWLGIDRSCYLRNWTFVKSEVVKK